MTVPRWEHMLLEPVVKYLRRRGYRYQFPEIGFFEQKIDLYAFSERQNVTLAVELKLRRWRYALRQTLLYQLCSDFVLIAMPATTTNAVDLELLRLHGVGLLAVNKDRCKQILAPEHSLVVRTRYRKAYIKIVKGME